MRNFKFLLLIAMCISAQIQVLKPIGDIENRPDTVLVIDLNEYYANFTSINVSGSICIDDDPTVDCFVSLNFSPSLNRIWAEPYTGAGKERIETWYFHVSNATETISDTISVNWTYDKTGLLPFEKTILSDKQINLTDSLQIALSDFIRGEAPIQYQVSSKKAKTKLNLKGDTLTIQGNGSLYTDTLLITASNVNGTTPFEVEVTWVDNSIARLTPMLDLANSPDTVLVIDLNQYYDNYTSATVSGSICVDDDPTVDCYKSLKFSPNLNRIWAKPYTGTGTQGIETWYFTIINANDTISDTISVNWTFDETGVLPYEKTLISDKQLNLPDSLQLVLSNYIRGEAPIQYQVTSKKTKTKLSLKSDTLTVKGNGSSYTDTLLITASNVNGTTPFEVEVTWFDNSIVRLTPMLDLANRPDTVLVIDLNQYYDNYTSATVSGAICVDDDASVDCYTSLYFSPTLNRIWAEPYLGTGTEGVETWYLKISNANDTISDTISVNWTYDETGVLPYEKTILSDKQINQTDSLQFVLSDYIRGEAPIQYQVSSKKAKTKLSLKGDTLTIKGNGSLYTDTLLITASNVNGATPFEVEVEFISFKPLLVKAIPDTSIQGYGEFYIDLRKHFDKVNSVEFKEINGKTFTHDDDPVLDYSGSYGSYTIPDLYVGYDGNDTLVLEVTAVYNGYKTSDTLLVYFGYKGVAPFLEGTLTDKIYDYDAGRVLVQDLATAIQGEKPMTYIAGSRFGIVKPVVLGTLLYVDINPLKSGKEEVVIMAQNNIGSYLDTIRINVNAPNPARFSKDYGNMTYDLASSVNPYMILSATGSGTLSYKAQSISGKTSPILNSNSLYFYPNQLSAFVDTILIQVENDWAKDLDTLFVYFRNSKEAPLAIQAMDIDTLMDNQNTFIDLSQYYFNQTSVKASLLSGNTCIDDDSVNDCYDQLSFSNNLLYLEPNGVGKFEIELIVMNSVDSLIDTLTFYSAQKTVEITQSILPIYALEDEEIEISLKDYFNWATTFSVVKNVGGACMSSYSGGCSTYSTTTTDKLFLNKAAAYSDAELFIIGINSNSRDTLPLKISFSSGEIVDQIDSSVITLDLGKTILLPDAYLGDGVNLAMLSKSDKVTFTDKGNGSFSLKGIGAGKDTLFIIIESKWSSIKDTLYVKVESNSPLFVQQRPNLKIIDRTIVGLDSQVTEIVLYDLTGKKIAETNQQRNWTIPENLNSGHFFIRIKYAGQYQMMRTYISK